MYFQASMLFLSAYLCVCPIACRCVIIWAGEKMRTEYSFNYCGFRCKIEPLCFIFGCIHGLLIVH